MFYKLNASRVSMREFWWETRLFVWVGLLVKIFRIRLRGSSDDLAVDSLQPFLVPQSKIRPEMATRFQAALKELSALGFANPIWHDQENVYQATRNTIATLLHSNGRTLARVQCRTNFGRVPAKVKFFITFISITPGGFISTGNGKYDMAWPTTHNTVRFRQMKIDQVWAAHQKRMTPSVQAISMSQLTDVLEKYHTSLREFHLQRGVFEPLGDEELQLGQMSDLQPAVFAASQLAEKNAEGVAPPTVSPIPLDLMEVATLDELRRLQNRKVNWKLSAFLLAVSAVVFALVSRNSDQTQDWRYIEIVLGILLFHELGHYVAMKIFGYRNLKMFFIPGFGAAVTGRHYNAPAWKKIVVSLMGPLPGILAGIICLAFWGLVHNQTLYLIGLLAIVINAFNLLPVLPFDGGWVAHAALFSRHPKLDVGFRVAAAVLVALIGMFVPGSHFLIYVAVASVLALPIASKLATIVSELRQTPGLGVSPDSQSIPPETARIILGKIRGRFKRNLNAKLAAQHIASVFESLNARPPSAGATVGLLSLHGFSFVLALIVGVLALGLNGRSLLNTSFTPAGTYTITANEIDSTPTAPTGSRNIVVLRFKLERTATKAYHEVASTKSACLFGHTLLVSFRTNELAEQRAFMNRYAKIAEDRFIATDRQPANVQMTFNLPDTDQGRDITKELQSGFGRVGWNLIPPWADESDWPADQRMPQTQMRLLVHELETPPIKLGGNNHLQEIADAQRDGDTERVDQLRVQIKKEYDDSERDRIESLRSTYGHDEFIQTWKKIIAIKDYKLQSDQLAKQIATQLGQWPRDKSDGLLAKSFAFYMNPATKTANLFCTFAHIDTGLPAMTRWLIAHGATHIEYSLSVGLDTALDDQTGQDD